MMARSVLRWQDQPRNAPITLADLMVLLFYLAWVAGCVAVMLFARRRRRSGWGWFFIAHTLSPLVAWIILLAIGRAKPADGVDSSASPPGRWRRRWASLSAPARIGLVAGICIVMLPRR